MKDFSPALLEWYDKNKRDLPWRREVTPYRVWISEIMLQQTRIEAAKDYFERFTAALPDVRALAEADEDTVLKLWQGLGYYSRARNLRKAARLVCETYGGELPADYEALRALPGVGDYTAGAIASIAFGLKESAVDGNVLRVVSRLERCGESSGSGSYRRRVRAELKEIMPEGRCGDFTAAVMELGETVCVPSTPDCGRCPLAGLCGAHAAGEETRYPVMPEKKPRRVEEKNILLLTCRGKTAVYRRPEKGLLAKLWGYPEGAPPEGAERCGEAVHVFSHVEWHMTGWRRELPEEDGRYVWVTAEEREALAIPTAYRAFSEQLSGWGY